MQMAAALSGSAEALREALSWPGADPRAGDEDGHDIFVYACASGSVESMEIARSAGAGGSAAKSEPLAVFAVESGSPEALAWLAKQGLLDMAQRRDGLGLMHLAAGSESAGAPKVIAELARLGGAVEAPDEKGWTPLFHAAEAKAANVVALLGLGANPKARAFNGSTPLMAALQAGAEEAAKALLPGSDWGAAVEGVEDTALHLAAKRCGSGIVAMLASPEACAARNGQGETPLAMAVSRSDERGIGCMAELAKHGSLEVRDCDGDTPLLRAAQLADIDRAKLLLAHGADPLAVNKAGRDALGEACWAESLAVVEAMIPLCPLGRVDKEGKTPLLVACQDGAADCARAIADEMLRRGMAADHATKQGRSAISLLASSSEGDSLPASLLAISDLDWADQDGVTPLMWAASAGRAEKVSALIQAGADVDRRDQSECDALMHAIRGKEEACARLLAQACDLGARDELGRSAAKLAKLCGMPELSGWLAALESSKRDREALLDLRPSGATSAGCPVRI